MTELQQAIATMGRRVFDSDPDPVNDTVICSYWALKLLKAFALGGGPEDPAEPLEAIVSDLLADMRHLIWLVPNERTPGDAVETLAMVAGADQAGPDSAYRAALAIKAAYVGRVPSSLNLAEVTAFAISDIRDLCGEVGIDFEQIDDSAGRHFEAEYLDSPL
jgi:hypothetical protein